MGLAKQEREMAARGEGCLGKAADDEPVFILRGRDTLAVAALAIWIKFLGAAELTSILDGNPINHKRLAKLREAESLLSAMVSWQADAGNGAKVPD